MCFSPQRRAIFQHLNFKKWSEADVFCTFSLGNVLLATAACNFWFLLWPHDSAPAALTSLLFDSPDTRIIGKNTAFRDFSNIWRGCIFFLLTFAQLHLLSSDFTSSHLLFNSPYCRKLLFKLPSIIWVNRVATKSIDMYWYYVWCNDASFRILRRDPFQWHPSICQRRFEGSSRPCRSTGVDLQVSYGQRQKPLALWETWQSCVALVKDIQVEWLILILDTKWMLWEWDWFGSGKEFSVPYKCKHV